MLAGLALALTLRQFLTKYIFDAVLFTGLVFAVLEIMRATKAKDKDIKYHYIFGYFAAAYAVFFIGSIITPAFSLLMQLLAQILVLFVFLIYTYLMYYVDTKFVKQCKLKKKSSGKACFRVLGGYLKIIGYPGAFIYALFALNHFNSAASYKHIGLFALLLVFVIAMATDTFAYLVGITLKGPKLCPKISPKKTWSGAVGGVFGGIIGAYALLLIFSTGSSFDAFFQGEKGINVILMQVLIVLIGLIGSVVSQFGDIYASWIKRKHGIKDFGKILPGHGGVMDRIDGHIACALFILMTMSIICFIL